MKLNQNKEKGFVALISVIIIAAILLIVATTLSFTGFFGRFNSLEYEYKERSFTLAEACADEAILKLIVTANYNGGETISVNGNNCSISTMTGIALKTFTTEASFQNAVTNIRVVFDTFSNSVSSWEEVPTI
jgi:hypothetical protein